MQGIYTHFPETNYGPREYSVAAILLLLFVVLISLVSVLSLLYFYISTFRSTCAVPSLAVFCSSLTSWFPGMLLTYFLNVFEIVPVAPIITGITFVFPFHIIIIIIITIIIEFLTSQLWLGNIHLTWDVVINRIRLGGLICSLQIFLQLNMCQELQIFAVVYMYSGTS